MTGQREVPPITRFLAEQLATAHWFDQRRTRQALGWEPSVTLEEGFARLADSYAAASATAASATATAATTAASAVASAPRAQPPADGPRPDQLQA
ncbi:hypothetical protein JD79_03290 [Geodermatophilus normandii]|uniref:Uncharacterized protein n=1 Tax=Geodermatophilus normandii TaxID=1137989 RepID=A0A317QL60_9ACTN|nr:hypothetical protein JD79_03290 [Geodermatophilus normandii]